MKTGSCHCGKVKFEADGEPEGALACNCSICSRKGSLLWFQPRSAFRLHANDADVGSYTFNKHVIRHRFCTTCGIHTHGEGVDPKGNAMVAVNIRCLDDFELDAVPVQHYDGRSI